MLRFASSSDFLCGTRVGFYVATCENNGGNARGKAKTGLKPTFNTFRNHKRFNPLN
ncbi:hypothetical protein DPMN_123951 [Dreissena polymorpha]|uniref:Uncharacterized protein n=1 Tax=Dreissena polymorpha TaxID=45954 RepID=A0A9D4GVH0_DREPO|nr:hypothetical protein DPMN_123951 [Dreissena polymorpha]